MDKDINYVIHTISNSEFRIAKYVNGLYNITYSIIKKNNEWQCSCVSGMYRHYCKHKEWIHNLLNNQYLPDDVSVYIEPDLEEVNNLMKEAVLV